MPVSEPDANELRSAAAEIGIELDGDQCAEYLALIAPHVRSYRALDELVAPTDPVSRPWWEPEDDPLGAWYVRTDVPGAGRGSLVGTSVALKDNVLLSGVPMMNGSATLRGYVPDADATVVDRLLDAGARIDGKAHCEHFCLSGGSHTNSAGPVRNPHDPERSAGGSSSGSAVLVAAGEVDLGIGGDQGGSVRIPASWCGIVGMKPTHGLVPYTGMMPIEATIDHTGPLTRDVAGNARALRVLAGPDGLDPRQTGAPSPDCEAALTGDCAGLRIGVLREGFGTPGAEADVDEAVRRAAESFTALGAEVAEVGVAEHRSGAAVWTPIAAEGLVWQMMLGNGSGMNWKGRYEPGLIRAMRGWRERTAELSEPLKVMMLVGNLFRRRDGGAGYARAQNQSRELAAAYDRALQRFDLLVMPTLPMKATPLPPADAPAELVVRRAFEMTGNTQPFDVTGHPAISVPCAHREGLPVGMMLVGRHFDEPLLYRAAHAFEQDHDWRQR